MLPARIPGYQPRLLDELGSLGEVAWVGRGSLGRDDGRIVLVRPGRDALRPVGLPDGTDRPAGPRHDAHPRAPRDARRLVLPRPAPRRGRRAGPRGARRALGPGLGRRGHQRHVRAAARPPLEADRWRRHAARAARPAHRARPARGGRPLVARRAADRARRPSGSTPSRWRCSSGTASLTREAVAAEGLDGGFSAVYPVLRALEEAGRIRRGYFVDGLGAAQFALPGALDRLRSARDAGERPETAEVLVLAAADPGEPVRRRPVLAASRRARPAAAPARRRRVRRAGRRRRRAVPRARRLDAPDAGARRRSGGRARRGRARSASSSSTAGSRSWSSRRSTARTWRASPFRERLLAAGFAPGLPGPRPARRPVPEGDTLYRTAAGLRPYLVGRVVTAARAQGPGPVPQVHRVDRPHHRRRRVGRARTCSSASTAGSSCGRTCA